MRRLNDRKNPEPVSRENAKERVVSFELRAWAKLV